MRVGIWCWHIANRSLDARQSKCVLRLLKAAELLGIKDLIEGGAFKRQQRVDLSNQAYPPVDGPAEAPRPAAQPPQSTENSAGIPEASGAVSAGSEVFSAASLNTQHVSLEV